MEQPSFENVPVQLKAILLIKGLKHSTETAWSRLQAGARGSRGSCNRADALIHLLKDSIVHEQNAVTCRKTLECLSSYAKLKGSCCATIAKQGCNAGSSLPVSGVRITGDERQPHPGHGLHAEAAQHLYMAVASSHQHHLLREQ